MTNAQGIIGGSVKLHALECIQVVRCCEALGNVCKIQMLDNHHHSEGLQTPRRRVRLAPRVVIYRIDGKEQGKDGFE